MRRSVRFGTSWLDHTGRAQVRRDGAALRPFPGATARFSAQSLARAALASVLVLLLLPANVLASREAPTTSDSTYRLKPARELVEVTVTMSIRNRKGDKVTVGPCPNAPSQRCRITTYYTYGAMGFVAPVAARKLKFIGSGVKGKAVRNKRGWVSYKVSFPPIRNGQSKRIKIKYQLPAAGPRSSNTTRVYDAYAHFCWHGQWTDRGSVTAILPRGYETFNRHGKVKTKTKKQAVEMRAKRKRNPGGFFACTDAFKPAKLVRTESVSPNGQSVVVEGWPEDPAWTETITEDIQTTIPALEEIICLPIAAEDVTIRQVAAQALEGYAGEFQPGSSQIRISERLDDPQLIAHELAHGWFHDGTLKELWMIEGLAEWAANNVTGESCREADGWPGKGKPRLRDWQTIGADPSDRGVAIVGYQYAAVCGIMAEVEALVGESRMRSIVRSLLFRWPKYTGAPSEGRGKADWREFLDAVDEFGLVPAGVEDLKVVEKMLLAEGIANKKQLKGRAAARTAYHEARAGALDGTMPRVVSAAMDDWNWKRALTGIEIAVDTMERIEASAEPGTFDSEALAAKSALRAATSLAELRRVRDGLPASP